MDLIDYLSENLVLTDLSVKDSHDAISAMAEVLYHAGYVKKSFADAAIAREKIYPTGIENEGYNFAIPHTDSEHVVKAAIAIAVLREPVEFARMDIENETTAVKLVFALAIKEPEKQIGALRSLMMLLQDHDFYDQICASGTAPNLLALIRKKIE